MNPPQAPADAWLVGGGIASLAAAAYLVRSGRVPGERIHVLEQSASLGGSLDASGSAAEGYSMRGSRMYGAAYVLMHELLAQIPSLDDPQTSVTEDTLGFWQQAPWDDRARLVERGRIVDAADFGLDDRGRIELIGLMLRDEDSLGARRIDQCFAPAFFESNFWWLWSSMFGFETWHGAAELRRYFLRFLRLFPDLPTMRIIQSTRYNGQDSIVRPLVRALQQQGVSFETGVQVTDLDFEPAGDRRAVRCLHVLQDGRPRAIATGASDLVIVTLGSMTAGAVLGSMSAPPPAAAAGPKDGAWALWERLAAKDPSFGRPAVFCGAVDRTTWITFTVTFRDERFVRRFESFSGRPAGGGGLLTLKGSAWGLTFHLFHPPAFAGQPAGVHVGWGYGLFPDRRGEFVAKPMQDCSGEEILRELVSQLGWADEWPALGEGSTCIPCRLPYTTSQFMPRVPGDRPPVVPPGTANLAFVGQYCELPHDVVYTVEYSVHSAAVAVATLLGMPQAVPPVYQGLEHPHALVAAMRRVLA